MVPIEPRAPVNEQPAAGSAPPAPRNDSLAVILLNWNGTAWLRQFLPGVIRHSPEAAVIVVDNASTDESLAVLRADFPAVEVIAHPENLGFCEGYNQAIARLEGRFSAYLLLNTDVEVTPGWLAPLQARLRSLPEIAAVQPKIRAWHARDSFEYAGAAGGLLDRYGYPFCRGRLFDMLERDEGQYDDARPVFWATGACLLVRASAWHTLGGLEPRFFAHMEEIDFCWRAQRAGWRIWVEPASTVYHVGGGTLPKSNPRKTYLNFHNGLALLVKNVHKSEIWRVLTVRVLLDWVAALRFLLTGQLRDAGAVFRAHWHVWKERKYWKQKRRDRMPKRRDRLPKRCLHQLRGVYVGSLVWAYFAAGKKRAAELAPQTT